jgi:hypothetical protein
MTTVFAITNLPITENNKNTYLMKDENVLEENTDNLIIELYENNLIHNIFQDKYNKNNIITATDIYNIINIYNIDDEYTQPIYFQPYTNYSLYIFAVRDNKYNEKIYWNIKIIYSKLYNKIIAVNINQRFKSFKHIKINQNGKIEKPFVYLNKEFIIVRKEFLHTLTNDLLNKLSNFYDTPIFKKEHDGFIFIIYELSTINEELITKNVVETNPLK